MKMENRRIQAMSWGMGLDGTVFSVVAFVTLYSVAVIFTFKSCRALSQFWVLLPMCLI